MRQGIKSSIERANFIKGMWDPESPRVYPHMMFKPSPSPFIAECAHTQLHSVHACVITDHVNGEGLDLVAGMVSPGHMALPNVGDSRIYLFSVKTLIRIN